MTFSIILSREWTEQFKQDTMNAINILMMRGNIDPETHYDFATDSKGKPRVRLWMIDGDGALIPQSLVNVDPTELITAAGKLSLVRGQSDSL